MSCLKALQKRLVLVPIDRASNNVGIICKRCYAEVMLNDIKLRCDETIDENTEYTKRLGFKITKKRKNATDHVRDS